jgi:hypothetical protein
MTASAWMRGIVGLLLAIAGTMVWAAAGRSSWWGFVGGLSLGGGVALLLSLTWVRQTTLAQTVRQFAHSRRVRASTGGIIRLLAAWLVIGAFGVTVLTALLRRFPVLLVATGPLPVSPGPSLPWALTGLYVGVSAALVALVIHDIL